MLGILNECFRAGISATYIRKVDTAMALCCSEVSSKEETSLISSVAVLTALPIVVTGYISKTSSFSYPTRGFDDLNQIHLKVRQGDDDSAQVFRLVENIFDSKDASA